MTTHTDAHDTKTHTRGLIVNKAEQQCRAQCILESETQIVLMQI